MKTIIAVLCFAILGAGFHHLAAQAPEKFNYQAVIRDGGGAPIKDQSVGLRLSILKDSPTGTPVYTETHASATNEFGLMTVQVGSGSSSDNFSSIDWKSGTYYLMVEVDPGGGSSYIQLGTSQLVSVPYAMYADESNPQSLVLDGSTLSISEGNAVTLPGGMTFSPWTLTGDSLITRVNGKVGIGTPVPGSKLVVQGDGTLSDSVLFEVKRKDGQTVFAVYPTGVQIFVEDLQTKGSKGGFAIGGFKGNKQITNEYMRVTPDSVRIYINEAAAKGSKGGFAIGGLSQKKGPANDFMRITPENYFIGQESGASITTGVYNSFMGYQSGSSTTEGDANIFLGYRSGFLNTYGFTNTFIGNNAGALNAEGYSNVFIGDSVGYNNNSNWNIFIGNLAGFSNTIGEANIAMGDMAGFSNTEGNWNVFIGDLAGYSNTLGESNVFIGADAGLYNEDGSYNVFLGDLAGWSNTSGSSNVFLGESSGNSNTIGESNVFLGTEAGSSNTEGNYNVFIGDVAGWSNTTGSDNVFMGTSAGEYNETGEYNVFIGTSSGNSNISGNYNVFIGDESGLSNSTGLSNVFMGLNSGESNTDGSYNLFLGTLSGNANVDGEQNVFLGQEAGYSNTSGSYNVSIGSLSGKSNNESNNVFIGQEAGTANLGSNNTMIGFGAGYSNIVGSDNVFLGYLAGYDGTGYNGQTSDLLFIDNLNNTWDQALIYGQFDNDYLHFYANVEIAGNVIAADFQLSDAKLKSNIRPIENALGDVMKLNGVNYSWNENASKGLKSESGNQIGLIAQDVEAVYPELVATSIKGEKAVNYAKLTAVLIEAMKEQQKMIEDLQQEVNELKAAIK